MLIAASAMADRAARDRGLAMLTDVEHGPVKTHGVLPVTLLPPLL